MLHRSVVFQLLLGGFLIGIFTASFLVVPGGFLWGGLSIAFVALIWRRPMAVVTGCILVSAVVGIWRTQSVLDRVSVLTQMADGTVITLEGYVDGDVSSTRAGVQYPFRTRGERVMVFGPSGLRPRYGQVLSITGKLQLPKNSGDFDYVSYLAKSDIATLMYFPEYSVPELQSPVSTRIWLAIAGRLHRVRDAMADSISHAVSSPESAYLGGILLGAQGIVSAEIKDMFARTGTSHILALSGYNITIIVSTLLAVLAPLGRRRAFGYTALGIAAFTVMTGASASVVRAAIMGVLALFSRQIGRQSQALGAIILSAAVMGMYNPMLLRWDIGFQFSFLALVGIIYLEPLIPGPRVIATTLAASALVLPLSLLYFGQLPIYTLPANMLVLPLVPLAMALGLATGVAGMVWPLAGQFIGQIAWLVAALQLTIIRFFAELPHATVEIHIPISLVIACYAALAVGLVSYYRKQTLHHPTRHD